MTPEAANEAFSTLAEQRAPALRRAALRATGDAHAAEEIVAETLARAWQHRDHFEWRGDGSLEAWLHGIAANVTGHWHRERLAEGRAARRLATRDRGVTEDASSEIIERVDAARFRERFDRASRSLTGDQRQAVAMRVLHDASYDEISTATGTTPATARARVSRGLRTFALVVGMTALLMVATAAASAAVSVIVDYVWPREQPVQVPSAQEVAAWGTLPITGVETSHGATFSATIGDMAIGAIKPSKNGHGRILHPALGTYVVEIPVLSKSVTDVIPSVSAQIYNRSTRADLTLPDPRTGARLGVAPDAYEVIRTSSPAVVRLPIRIRHYDAVGEAGMRCLRARFTARGSKNGSPQAVRSALLGALEDCRMIPGVMPELDLEATKHAKDGPDILDDNAGTPLDLSTDMEMAINVSITELGEPTANKPAQWAPPGRYDSKPQLQP